jgi:hypothetical protein
MGFDIYLSANGGKLVLSKGSVGDFLQALRRRYGRHHGGSSSRDDASTGNSAEGGAAARLVSVRPPRICLLSANKQRRAGRTGRERLRLLLLRK